MEVCCNTQSHFRFLPSSSPHHRFKSSHFHFHIRDINHPRKVALLRATSDNDSTKFSENWKDPITTLKDVPTVDNDITLDNTSPATQTVINDSRQPQQIDLEESSSDESGNPFQELVNDFDFKLNSEDSYTVFLYGGAGSLVAIWLLSAVVGAIDSIPVFPKLLEVVGLGYSLWFTTRYLLFKKNREELFAKINEVKREVLGSGDN